MVHCSYDSIFHKGFAKIEQVTELFVREFQVSLDLFSVSIVDLLDGFELKHHQTLDNDVRAKPFVELQSLVLDG